VADESLFETPQLEVKLERLGRKIRGIGRYQLTSRFTQPTDSWSFTAYEDDDARRDDLFNLELEPVALSILGQPQVLGRIEVTESGEGLSRNFQGRDYLADLAECHCDPRLILKEPMTVAEAIKYAAGPVGISRVEADAEIKMRNVRTGKAIGGPAPDDFRSLKLKDFKPRPGEGIYEFLGRVTTRHGTTMQAGTSRDTIVLAQPDYHQEVTFNLVRNLSGKGNTILSGKARRDYTSFPTLVLGTTTTGVNVDLRNHVGKTLSLAQLQVNFNHEIIDIFDTHTIPYRVLPGETTEAPKLYRLHHFRDTDARNAAQLDRSKARRYSELLKDLLIYRCTVRGHIDPVSGALYAVNTMALVRDEVERVKEPMWIQGRTFKYSKPEGATTDLELWRPGSFQL